MKSWKMKRSSARVILSPDQDGAKNLWKLFAQTLAARGSFAALRMTHVSALILSLFILLACLHPIAFAYLFAYPEKGQTPEQQALDDQVCQKKARGKTKFDPAVMLSPAGTSMSAMIKQRKAEYERGEKLKKFQMVYSDCMKSRGYAVPVAK